jgi:transposase InsO family protein
MPWLESALVDLRESFVTEHQRGLYSMRELCERCGISRKTGYKWVDRFAAGGRAALADRSHAPHHCPHRISEVLSGLLCAARQAHPTWGASKLIAYLARRYPALRWPAASTASDLLARRGLVRPRRRRPRVPHPGLTPLTPVGPNDLWTIDYKGQFKTGDGRYCYPLTVADQASRYLLACQALRSTQRLYARQVLERVFRTYGLPSAIRSDNGVPFVTTGLHGLSALSVWWMRLGIQHQRILPAHPQQNGAHERMHKTLKAETTRPPGGTLAAQQRAFTAFRQLYNAERPHAALHNDPPEVHYRPSPRPYPARLPPLEYPGHFLVKRITPAGTFRFKNRLLFLGRALTHQPIGLTETDDGLWSIYLGAVLVAKLDEHDYRIRT